MKDENCISIISDFELKKDLSMNDNHYEWCLAKDDISPKDNLCVIRIILNIN